MEEGNSFRMNGQKILVVRFSAMGDIVLTSPVVRLLKMQLNAEVHFLTKDIFADLWRENPYLSKIWTIKKDLNEVISALNKEKFDAVIDLHSNLRTLSLRFYLWGIPFYHCNKGSLLRWFYVQTGFKPVLQKHIVTRYLETLRTFPVSYDGKGLDFFVSEKGVLLQQKPYIILVLGAAHFTKRIPFEKWKQIISSFHAHSLVLIGGKDDVNLGKALEGSFENKVINRCGETDVLGSALLMKHAELVITGDTGMMHIAAALRKPVVSIWGGTIPEFGWLPFYPEGMNRNKTVQVENLSCRPCSRFGRSECPKKHFRCMNEISSSSVYEEGQLLLKHNYS